MSQRVMKRSPKSSALRLDIPLSLLRQLLSRASSLVRSRLLAASTPENREQIQRALAGIVNEVGREAAGPRDFTRADSLVYELNRHGKLNEAAMIGFIKERKYEEMTATLPALFCGAKSDLIERLLKNVRHDGLVIACKAAKLTWPTVELLLGARFSHHSITQPELQHGQRCLHRTVSGRRSTFDAFHDGSGYREKDSLMFCAVSYQGM